MSIPATSVLGRLQLIEVYEYFDRPVLFSCRNASDRIFLAVLVDESQDSEVWLYLGMSQRRFEHIRSGAVSLHDAFLLSEDGTVWKVIVPRKTGSESFAEPLISSDISDKWLPVDGEFITLPTTTLPDFQYRIEEKAVQMRREILRLALSFPDSLRTEAPAVVLAKIMLSLQHLIDAIGVIIETQAHKDSKDEPPSIRGAIPGQVRQKMELTTISAGPGSFQLELASSDTVDMFGYSPVGVAINEFFTLISISSDASELTSRLQDLSARVAARYLDFLEPLRDSVHKTQLEWATPNEKQRRQVCILNTDAQAAIEIIQEATEYPPQEFEIVGILIGANLRTRKYEITSESETKRFKKFEGDILNEAFDSVTNATLSRRYRAIIREITTLKPITHEESVAYQLIRLEPYGWQPQVVDNAKNH